MNYYPRRNDACCADWVFSRPGSHARGSECRDERPQVTPRPLSSRRSQISSPSPLVELDGQPAPSGRWRLLETTRQYALEKLAQSGETEKIARRCAEFSQDLLGSATTHGLQEPPTVEDMARNGREIDNVPSTGPSPLSEIPRSAVSLRAEAANYLRSKISICDEPAGERFAMEPTVNTPSDRRFFPDVQLENRKGDPGRLICALGSK